MPDKARLGKRYVCFKCGCKFYDLNQPEAACPRCGVDQAEDPTPDPRVAVMSRYKTTRAPVRQAATFDDAELDEEEETDIDEEDDDTAATGGDDEEPEEDADE